MLSLTPLQQAEALLSMRHYDESIKAYQELLDGEERSYAVRGLIRAYRSAGKRKEGLQSMRSRLAAAREPADYLYGLGYWFFLEEQMDKAQMYLEEAVEIRPNHSLALNSLGAVYSEDGRHEEAWKKVKRALQLNPSELMFYHNLYRVYKKGGNEKRFLREFKAQTQSGQSALALGYGKVLAINLRQAGFKLYSKGAIKQATDKFEEMASIYKEINYIPGLTAAWFSLGLLYEEQQKADLAIEFFRKVLKLSPGHLQAGQRLEAIEKEKSDLSK